MIDIPETSEVHSSGKTQSDDVCVYYINFITALFREI